MTGERLVQWRLDLAHVALLAGAILLVHAPAAARPLRPWDHHAILLLAALPHAGSSLVWRLLHYHIGFEQIVFFKILSMPTVYAIARLFQDHGAWYYGLHFLVHLGVAVVLYLLVVDLSGVRPLGALTALLFSVYSAHPDTVASPYYTYLLLAVLAGGAGAICVLRHLRERGRWSLVLGTAAFVVATLFYDAFLLLALAIPPIAMALTRATDRAVLRTVVGLVAGTTVTFGAVLLSVTFAPPLPGVTGSPLGRGLRATATALTSDFSIPMAGGYAVWAVVSDLVVFLTGHFPGIWHLGNLPYWDLTAVTALAWKSGLALALFLAGGTCLRRCGWRGGVLGAALLVAGAVLDLRPGLLAVIIGIAGWGAGRDARVAFLATCAVLTAFNVALGRGLGYNVAAFRHHYVSGFFVLATVAALVATRWRARPAWQNRLLLGALGVCVFVNAQVTQRVLAEVARENERVFAFDRALGVVARTSGPGVLFASFPTSVVEGADWRRNPVQDVVFDLLHSRANPLTRHVSRARFVVNRDGIVRPNPSYGRDDGVDFAFRFTLRAFLPGRYELFGSAPGEPRIVFEPGRLSFVATRRGDGRAVAWRFQFPSATKLPAVVTLVRQDRTLRLSVDGATIGAATLGEDGAYHGWESDNLGLLGRDFERLTVFTVIAESYMRIGRSPEGEEMT